MELDFLPDIGRNPDYGLSGQPAYNVDTVSFGDGYEQRRPSGLNSVKRSWTVTWSLITQDQMQQLRDFLNQRMGVHAFLWQADDEPEARRVVCKTPPQDSHDTFGRFTLTAQFTEDFGL